MEAAPFPLEVSPPAISEESQAQESHRQFTQKLFNDFWDFPIADANKALEEQSAAYWEQKGIERALQLFQAAAQRVPAYKDFLQKNNIKAELIKTADDFKQIPPVHKKNYLQVYPREALLWDGRMNDSQMIAVSSGSSGEPFFWPRAGLLELETTYVQELYLKEIFHIDQYSTLYLDCFAMGMYIAGPIILNSALRVSQKGYPMTVITPGLAMSDIIRVITNLAPHFEQIVLAGYPPYIKDVIEEARKAGFDWSKYKTRMLLAGEGFSEQWRDYVGHLVGDVNVKESIINIYGTADASIVAHETPASIAIRRLASENREMAKTLFNDRYAGRLPTFVQYLPTQKYFEVVDQELHFTATSGIPLIRYNIHDDGGVVGYDQAMQVCQQYNYEIQEMPAWKLPFVYLYGRSDFTVVLYGANVYPENIKMGLEAEEIRNSVTGRFVMTIERDDQQDPYLLLKVELADNSTPSDSLREKIAQTVARVVRDNNDEYQVIYTAKGDKALPRVQLYAKGDEQYFGRTRNKQRWKE